MFASFSLYKKILFSNLLASFVFLSILTLIIYVSNEQLESQLLDIQISSELENIKNKLNHSPDLKLPRTAHFSIYLKSRIKSDPLPLFIQDLNIGSHHEIKSNQRAYQVSISQHKLDTIYILYDITAIEVSDNQLGVIIFSSWLLLLGIMLILSHKLSHSISKPIQQLRDKVLNITADQRGIHLNTQHSHSEINDIAVAFNQYLNDMDEYVTQQMAFSAMASHELRSPLTIVQTSAELIGCLHNDVATLEHVQKIQRSSNNMSQLIHALLHITRDKNTAFEQKSIRLNDCIKDLDVIFKTDLNAKKCRLISHIDEDSQVLADEILLKTVLSNIIKNAIKFSQQSNILLNFSNNTLEVIDAGTGIDNDALKQIFDFKFKNNNSQGFGIGLYISKLICDHQGWALEITQNNHQGITAKITFLT